MWTTFGHENVKNILEKQLASKEFAHAYFFAGPDGVGKRMLAEEFGSRVLSLDKTDVPASPSSLILNPSIHPDFLELDLAEEVGVEEVRDFIEKISYKPFLSSHKVAVINNAHFLNSQSGNALLKTLEEPGEHTIIILIASSARLLPTIVSRCQKFTFNPFSLDQLRQFAEHEKIKAGEELLNLAFGSPSRLRLLASDAKLLAAERAKIQQLEALKNQPKGQRLTAIASLAEKESEELAELFTLWLMSEKTKLAQHPARYTSLAALSGALEQLKTNKNKKLVLQGLLLGL